MAYYHTHERTSSRRDLLIRYLLTQGLIDVEGDKLIQHRIVPYARRHEGIRWYPCPDLPGCVTISEPFNPETWEGCPIGGLSYERKHLYGTNH